MASTEAQSLFTADGPDRELTKLRRDVKDLKIREQNAQEALMDERKIHREREAAKDFKIKTLVMQMAQSRIEPGTDRLLEEASAKIEVLKAKNSELDLINTGLTAKVESMAKTFNHQAKKHRAECAGLRVELQDGNESNSSLADQIKQTLDTINNLTEKLERLETERRKAEEEMFAARKLADLRGTYIMCLEGKLAETQSQVHRHNNTVHKLSGAVAERDVKISSLQAQAADLEQQKNSRAVPVRTRADSPDIRRLNKSIGELSNENNALKRKMKANSKSTNAELQVWRERVGALESVVKKLNKSAGSSCPNCGKLVSVYIECKKKGSRACVRCVGCDGKPKH